MRILAWASCLVVALSATVSAQDAVLTITDQAGAPGETVSSSVLLDNNTGQDLTGWSFGVCNVPGELTISAIASGNTALTINGGGPVEFESLDLFAGGMTHAVVISFMVDNLLPVGSGYELANLSVDLDGADGTSPQLCFCDTLGTPPVEALVVDTVASGIVPIQNCGTFDIAEPLLDPTGVTCQAVPMTCVCDGIVTWTNNSNYDSVNIYQDGALVDSLPGGATQYTTPLGEGSFEFCVEGVRNGEMTAQVCCTAACSDVVVDPLPVEDLTCSVDTDTCQVTVNWTAPQPDSTFEVTLDGASQVTGLTTTSFVLTIPATGSFEVCVTGLSVCGDALPPTCCTVTCETAGGLFIRGDVNVDNSVNIADGVAVLNILFTGATGVDCLSARDANDDDSVNIADAVYILNFLFVSGPEPVSPFPSCGSDLTMGSLGCNEFDICP